MGGFTDNLGPMSSTKKSEKKTKKNEEKKNRSYMIPTSTLEKLALMEVRSDLNRSEIVTMGIDKMYEIFESDKE